MSLLIHCFLVFWQHFKLGDYSFQIKAYEPENNTLQSNYRFKKPITITLVYDVDQMLKQNKKVVSDDVTNEDIDPVLLLWDEKNQTWYFIFIVYHNSLESRKHFPQMSTTTPTFFSVFNAHKFDNQSFEQLIDVLSHA